MEIDQIDPSNSWFGALLFQSCYEDLKDVYDITMPQSKPLSPGEILGCTSPRLPANVDTLV